MLFYIEHIVDIFNMFYMIDLVDMFHMVPCLLVTRPNLTYTRQIYLT